MVSIFQKIRRSVYLNLLILCFFCGFAGDGFALPQDRSKAVILVYERIGEDAYPGQSLSVENFTAQMDALQDMGAVIMPVPKILKYIEQNEPLPRLTVGITFDGGYASASTHAFSILAARKFPFSVFLDVDAQWDIDPSYATLMDVGLHFNTSMTDTEKDGLLKAIHAGRRRYRAHFNKEARLYSTARKSDSSELSTLMESQGFTHGFSYSPSVAFSPLERFSVPRFLMNDDTHSMARFRRIINALPMPVRDETPISAALPSQDLIAGMTFIQDDVENARNKHCALSDSQDISFEQIGQRLEIRAELLGEDASLVCTQPTKDDKTVRWYGRRFVVQP